MNETRVSAENFVGILAEENKISPKDVLYFRGEVFRDGVVSRQEADALLAMNSQVAEKCQEWNEFFVEALTEYTVFQAEPRGYVTVDNAQWIIDAVNADGRVEAASELELLVRILSKSNSSPEMLVGFTLDQIGHLVLEGEGPLANGRLLEKAVIGETEVELIRAVLYSFGGDGGISISKTEAEFLFDLNDALAPEGNHPAWRELFVKAIGNYLLAAASYSAPSRTEALAREEWLSDTSSDVAGTLTGAVSGITSMFSRGFFDGIFDDAHGQIEKAWKIRNEKQVMAEYEAEKLDAVEAEWLIDKLFADGVIHENERALLSFIKRESHEVNPKLQELMDKESIPA
ncbi:MAG: hypothetical protein ACR2O0_09860 [Rhizobiaceae bacterium]